MTRILINPNFPEFVHHLTTNRQPRDTHSWHDLSVKEREWFDYITGDDRHSLRLFQYRGSWYDYYEFERTSEFFAAEGWDGMQSQSAFDAILISFHGKGGELLDDQVIVGHIHW